MMPPMTNVPGSAGVRDLRVAETPAAKHWLFLLLRLCDWLSFGLDGSGTSSCDLCMHILFASNMRKRRLL